MIPRSGGREVSRIEGFSDAVFGFALTLLVASIEVPARLRGAQANAARLSAVRADVRADLVDLVPALLVLPAVRPRGSADDRPQQRAAVRGAVLRLSAEGRWPTHLVGIGQSTFDSLHRIRQPFPDGVYSSGVIAVFLVFFLLNWNAYRQRGELELTPDGSLRHRHGAARARIEHAAGRGVGDPGDHAADELFWTVGTDLRPGGTAPGRQRRAIRAVATRESASFIDASAPVSSSRERQVQKRM